MDFAPSLVLFPLFPARGEIMCRRRQNGLCAERGGLIRAYEEPVLKETAGRGALCGPAGRQKKGGNEPPFFIDT
jgi:hypothetical protein